MKTIKVLLCCAALVGALGLTQLTPKRFNASGAERVTDTAAPTYAPMTPQPTGTPYTDDYPIPVSLDEAIRYFFPVASK